MCVPSWPRTEDLCAFLSAAFDNARPKPVDIFLPPLRLPPIVFVVSLLLDDVHAMYVSHARLCSGGNVKSRRRFETSLFSRAWRILLVNTESGALLFDERRTRREKERESFITRPSLSSIARASILVREKSASLFSSHRAGEINRTDRITSRRVNAYIYT